MRPSTPLLVGWTAALLSGCFLSVSPQQNQPDANVSVDSGTLQPDVNPPQEASVPDVFVGNDSPTTCDLHENAGYVSISFRGPDNVAHDCSATPTEPGPGPNQIEARTGIVNNVFDDADGAHVVLDFCSPAADCVPMLGTITIRATGFQLSQGPTALRTGQMIALRTRVSRGWACTMQVELRNAPSWDGYPNPVRQDSVLLAAVGNGESSALPDVGFSLSQERIGCVQTGGNCGGGPPELFALSFQGHCDTCIRDPDPVLVRQGQQGYFQINDGSFEARNLRSFNSGNCDDYWNWAWWVREIWQQ